MANKPTKRKSGTSRTKVVASKRAGSRKGTERRSSLKVKATPAGASDKDHLIDVIQAGTGSSKKAAKETLDAFLDTVIVSLKKNKKVQLYGFGAFEVAKRRARKGHNPATGESIRIKASKRVRFRPGAKLRGGI